MPSPALIGLVSPFSVIILTSLFLKRYLISFIILLDILILFNTLSNISRLTVSNTFAVSWRRIHSSFCFSLTSSQILLSNWIGSKVLSPGNPAKFGPLRIFFSLHIVDILFVSILMKHFLVVSINIISLVFISSAFQSLFLSIGYILLIFQDLGIILVIRQQ